MNKTNEVTRSDDYETTSEEEAREYIAALRQAMEQVPPLLERSTKQAAVEQQVVA